MARLESLVNGSYYPTPTEMFQHIVDLFTQSEEQGRILDPVAGEGTFVNFMGMSLNLKVYANELNKHRAQKAADMIGRDCVVEGDMYKLEAPQKAFNIVYCNPPYTWETNVGQKSTRRELDMLQHSFRWVAPGGYIVWCVYAQHVTQRAANYLYQNCTEVDAYKFPGLHLNNYEHVILVGRRGSNVNDYHTLGRELSYKTMNGEIPSILDAEYGKYKLGPAVPVKDFRFFNREFTPDRIEKVLAERPPKFSIWEDLKKVTPKQEVVQPIAPIKEKQFAMLLLGGLFDGIALKDDNDNPILARTKNFKMIRNTQDPEHPSVTVESVTNTTHVLTINQRGEVQKYTTEVDISEFIKANKKQLMAHVKKNFVPQYNFDYSEWAEVLDGLKKPVLYKTQKHIIASVLTGLKSRSAVMLSGQPGVGKTIMGSMVLSLQHKHAKKGQISVVTCPSHLVEKWMLEFTAANPSAVVMILNDIKDVDAIMKSADENPAMHLAIISMAMSKLGEGWSGAFARKTTKAKKEFRPILCPTCGQIVSEPHYSLPRREKRRTSAVPAMTWVEASKLSKRTAFCQICHNALWSDIRSFKAKKDKSGNTENARYPLALYIAKKYKNRVYTYLADEVHEMKDPSSGQGLAFSRLYNIADKVVLATGTLFGGVASSLYLFMFMISPQIRKEYPWVSMTRWVEDMGNIQTKIITSESVSENGHMTHSVKRQSPAEAPGISPMLIRHVIEASVFVGLTDIRKMKPINEYIIGVDMDETSSFEYHKGYEITKSYAVEQAMDGDRGALSPFHSGALRYPDTAYEPREVIHNVKTLGGTWKYLMHKYGKTDVELLAKEESMVELITEELANNRGVAVFVEQTGEKNLESRLMSIINDNVPGAKPFIIKAATVSARDRDALIKKKVAEGYNIIICNPALVKTGLDLLSFPTIIFMEISYSLYTVAQAACRARRINQEKDCKVYYLYYKNTVQQNAVMRVANKSASAALLTGENANDGLGSAATDKYYSDFVDSVADGEAVSVFDDLLEGESLWVADNEELEESPEPVVSEVEAIPEPVVVEIPVIQGPIIPVEIPTQRKSIKQQLQDKLRQLSLFD